MSSDGGPAIKPVVLAAGASRRLGRPKQLLEIGGERLIRRTVRVLSTLAALRQTVTLPALVVTDAYRGEVTAALAGEDAATVLHNPDWASGMASSLRVGVTAALDTSPCTAVLVALCDQPRVSATGLVALIDAYCDAPHRIAAAAYDGRLGVPAVFPRSHCTDLVNLSGDEGARRVLRRAGTTASTVDLPEAAFDVDTPADLELLDRTE